MKYALFEGKRVEPKKGLNAVCPFCGCEVIAKCGTVKMHHWAHTTVSNCDKWKENELPWHRNWKNQFPAEWQERIFIDTQTGEKHIADICTDHNFVIEFQHSPISEEEKRSREHFYKNMCWIADSSGERDRKRFFDKASFLFQCYGNIDNFGSKIYTIDNPLKILPKKWADRTVFVCLDFKGDSLDPMYECLWSIVPILLQTDKAVTIQLNRQVFIEHVKNNTLPIFFDDVKNRLNKLLQERADRWHIHPIRK